MRRPIPRHILSASVLTVLVLLLTLHLARIFRSALVPEPVYPGPGVTGIAMLSDWMPALKGTHGDTEVYILDSGVEGAGMLVLGGTHPNEPSGFLSAVALIESCQPTEGVLYVIPRANNSAFTCTDPQEASPMRYQIDTPYGKRWFRYGSRATNPIDQWPDSEVYIHASSGQQLSGSETRNLNRAYPGREDGTFTEKVAYGITSLIRDKHISITVDLHEASPEYTTVNAIVAHERALDLANVTLMMVEDQMKVTVEKSPANLHGLTHRELGDYTDTLALLMETANASQGRLHGAIDADLVVTGKDRFYARAATYGAVTVPYTDAGISIDERCARHLTCIASFAEMYDGDDGFISLGELPSYEEIVDGGIGQMLAGPDGQRAAVGAIPVLQDPMRQESPRAIEVSQKTEETIQYLDIAGEKVAWDGTWILEPESRLDGLEMDYGDVGYGKFNHSYPVMVSTRKLLEGTPEEVVEYHIHSDNPGPAVYIVAGIHGDERAAWYAGQLLQRKVTIKSGDLYIIAPANATGARKRSRYVEGTLDMNRSFPGSPEGNVAERAAYAVFSRIQEVRPDVLLDLHEAIIYKQSRDFLGSTYIFSMLDGIEDLYFDMLFATQEGTLCHNEFASAGPGPKGSINAEVSGRLDIPAITVETFRGFPMERRVYDQLDTVHYVLSYEGMYDEE